MLPEITIIKLEISNLVNDSLIIANFKNIIFMEVGKPNFREGQTEK